jgi:hypothetical protein
MTTIALSSPFDVTDFLAKGSPGASEAASAIFRQINTARRHARDNASDWRTLVKTLVFGLRREATAVSEDEASLPDRRALLVAARFVDALPFDLVPPAVALDTDGEISLDWWFGPYAQFSISVGPTGKLTYAGLMGPEVRRHGVELFRDKVPEILLVSLGELVRRFGPSNPSRRSRTT